MKNNPATILVTGANGQLGSELQVLSAYYPAYRFLFVTRKELPLGEEAAVQHYFDIHSIDYCINCAAYTAVDKAETEPEQAFHVNATAVGYLARACEKKGARLIHISTDYVFDGTATAPVSESQPVHPLGIYGLSKQQGEELAMLYHPAVIIIRTSWVYSSFGNNFVKTMLRLMKERESIHVVNDQQGCPTYAADLAKAILQVIDRLPVAGFFASPVFHYSNAGSITWYDFACTIRELTENKCQVYPIPSSQYPTPARRPQYSVLDTTKIRRTFGIQIPEWKDSLKQCLRLLENK